MSTTLKVVSFPQRADTSASDVTVAAPVVGSGFRAIGVLPFTDQHGPAAAIVFDNSAEGWSNGVLTDTVGEFTAAAGVTVDGVLLKDSQVTTDQVNEKTPAAGVTIDGVLLKDSQVKTDTIIEKTGAAGVTIDGLLIKDAMVNVDTINEATGATGVTIDGVLLKDSQVTTDVILEKTVATGVTIDGVLLKDSQVTTDVILEKTVATGVTIDGVLLKDGQVAGVTIRPTETVTAIPPTAGATVTKYAPVVSNRAVSAIDVWTNVIVSAGGGVTLTVKKQPANVTMLVAASYNLETPSDKALTALGLTATGADLILTTGDWIEFVVASDNGDMTGGENLQVIVIY